MSWLVNPESEDEFNDEEAVLFNAEDSLDFEDNPRGRRKKSKRRKKAGRPRKAKRGGKKRRRTKKVIKMIEVPRRRRRTVKRRRKTAARKPKRKTRRRRRSKGASLKGIMKRLEKMGPRGTAVPSKYASNASWKGQPRRHKKAAKKGWRRRRKAGRSYQQNPRRIRRRSIARRPWKARIYKQNPYTLGGIKAKMFGDHWYSLPTGMQISAHPVQAIGFGILGVVDTSLIAMAVDYSFLKFGKKAKIPEPAQDLTRIIVGRFVGGSLISYGIKKMSGRSDWGKYHQMGVYVSTILDGIGTAIKYIMRASKSKKVKVKKGIPYNPFLGPKNFAASIFGMGSIMGAWEEQKLLASIQADGLVVATNGEGHVALANANTGEIIVSGPAEHMGDLINAVQGVAVAYDGDVDGAEVEGDVYQQRPIGVYQPVTDSGGMGEDISSES